MEAKEWRQSRMCKVCRWKILITFKELKGLHEQDGGQEEKVHSEDGNACLEVKSHRALDRRSLKGHPTNLGSNPNAALTQEPTLNKYQPRRPPATSAI